MPTAFLYLFPLAQYDGNNIERAIKAQVIVHQSTHLLTFALYLYIVLPINLFKKLIDYLCFLNSQCNLTPSTRAESCMAKRGPLTQGTCAVSCQAKWGLYPCAYSKYSNQPVDSYLIFQLFHSTGFTD